MIGFLLSVVLVVALAVESFWHWRVREAHGRQRHAYAEILDAYRSGNATAMRRGEALAKAAADDLRALRKLRPWRRV